ncbi:glycoside hydrolase family 3 N-terminal domain-containing protein [Roseibacillus persicicus]|uniref:glycoside hydrolase family 3 N-terminal domain-containing protein n=1 Tax=Roseibacillus persicicus TaxID=454148 RepID=UPI00280EF6FA|nr:glycoside hydrolase family 3 N-terminal domain-containing protein [Roseibacillus persicicus]MDQ8192136.1 glycoside hydrolase family 3 N-terminal domain-containing protein [Roseibacillus persicicus]
MLPLILGLEGPTLTDADRDRIAKWQPAGFILFTRNIVDASQTRALTDELRELSEHSPIIGIDNEGGRVWRTAGLCPTPPNAATFGEKGTYKQSAWFGALAGRHLEMLGVNMNFAPDLDIDHQPEDSNALRGRCWGRDSQSVIDHAGNFSRWQRKNGVLSCGKHFPAGGRARVDPHHDLPVVEATLDELLATDLLPYTALAPELDAIMIAHIRYPALDSELPSSLSRRIITDLLRNQLGYEGLILTDDLDMGAITNGYGRGRDFELAWLAGNDLPLLCHELDTLDLAAEAFGKLPSDRRFDIEDRLEKTLRKLPIPPAFSIEKLDKCHRELSDLTKELTGEESFTIEAKTQSPVEDY